MHGVAGSCARKERGRWRPEGSQLRGRQMAARADRGRLRSVTVFRISSIPLTMGLTSCNLRRPCASACMLRGPLRTATAPVFVHNHTAAEAAPFPQSKAKGAGPPPSASASRCHLRTPPAPAALHGTEKVALKRLAALLSSESPRSTRLGLRGGARRGGVRWGLLGLRDETAERKTVSRAEQRFGVRKPKSRSSFTYRGTAVPYKLFAASYGNVQCGQAVHG